MPCDFCLFRPFGLAKGQRVNPIKCVEVDGHGVNVFIYIKCSLFLAFSPFQYRTQLPFCLFWSFFAFLWPCDKAKKSHDILV